MSVSKNDPPSDELIDFEKGSSLADMSDQPNMKENAQSQMEQRLKGILNYLVLDDNEFSPENALERLMEYCCHHQRLLYSQITVFVYANQKADERNEDKKVVNKLEGNLQSLIDYVGNPKKIEELKNNAKTDQEKKEVDDAIKVAWKIYDHVCLAQKQYMDLKQSDKEYQEKFSQSISPVINELTSDMSKKLNELTSEMSAQLLTMVGIFTALSFVLFGGIDSLGSVFTELKQESLLKLMTLACVWGIGMLNIIFVFLFCIGKMTRLNFKTSNDPKAGFLQKYPVVGWTNYILIVLMVGLMWVQLCIKKGMGTWASNIMTAHPKCVSIGGTIILGIVFWCSFSRMCKKTISLPNNEGEKKGWGRKIGWGRKKG